MKKSELLVIVNAYAKQYDKIFPAVDVRAYIGSKRDEERRKYDNKVWLDPSAAAKKIVNLNISQCKTSLQELKAKIDAQIQIVEDGDGDDVSPAILSQVCQALSALTDGEDVKLGMKHHELIESANASIMAGHPTMFDKTKNIGALYECMRLWRIDSDQFKTSSSQRATLISEMKNNLVVCRLEHGEFFDKLSLYSKVLGASLIVSLSSLLSRASELVKSMWSKSEGSQEREVSIEPQRAQTHHSPSSEIRASSGPDVFMDQTGKNVSNTDPVAEIHEGKGKK